MKAAALVVELPAVLDDPGPACDWPASERICFAVECPHNLTRRLGRGVSHSTRCDRDEIPAELPDPRPRRHLALVPALKPAPGFARGEGERRDCARADECAAMNDRQVRAKAQHRDPPVHCPTDCPAFEPERSPR